MENVLSFPTTSTPAKAPQSPKQSRKSPIGRSSWVKAVRYHGGFLVVFTKQGGCFIFEGVPSEVCGLVLAGTGGKSVGHAVHQLLREKGEGGKLGEWKYQYEYKGKGEEVEELWEMMK